jgi:hypothetical protein
MWTDMAVQRYKRNYYVEMTGSGELRTSIITNTTTMFQLQLLDKKISIMKYVA